MKQDIPLGTAIREGSKLAPQAFKEFVNGEYASCDHDHHSYDLCECDVPYVVFSTCALGAAAHHIGEPDSAEEMNYAEVFGLLDAEYECPEECDDPTSSYYEDKKDMIGMITHLNDKHRWTREAIADWVDRQLGGN